MPTSRVRATVDSERADHESWLKMISELQLVLLGACWPVVPDKVLGIFCCRWECWRVIAYVEQFKFWVVTRILFVPSVPVWCRGIFLL